MNIFTDIIGQDFACGLLQNELNANKTSQAYLFSGPAGCGKFEVSVRLACALLMDGNFAKKDLDQAKRGANPDIKLYVPLGVHGYLINQIKEIVADSNRAPINASKKVYIINNAEKLGTSGANAFLKTLEEPPAFVTFILITNGKENVLPTIISRCQTVDFMSLPKALAIKYVSKEAGTDVIDAEYALNLFGGNTQKAIMYCLDQNMIDMHDEVIHVAKNCKNLSDWQTLQRSKDINLKIKEICNVYKNELDEQVLDVQDILDGPALRELEKQNKRAVTIKQTEMLYFLCACIKNYFLNRLQQQQSLISKMEADNEQNKCVQALNVLGEYEQCLAYNISSQNFCDVVLLETKKLQNLL